MNSTRFFQLKIDRRSGQFENWRRRSIQQVARQIKIEYEIEYDSIFDFSPSRRRL